jgi:hypothetical protein
LRAALVLLAGCWTGTVVEPQPEPVAAPKSQKMNIDLEVKLRQTTCLGMCPVYDVQIARDGVLHYTGRKNVAETGERSKKLTRQQMLELSRSVDHVHFFELDGSGHEPVQQKCTQIGNTTTCSLSSTTFCSDTSHSIVSVTRPRQSLFHTVDDAHCSDDSAIVPLEQKIEELVAPWVGR